MRCAIGKTVIIANTPTSHAGWILLSRRQSRTIPASGNISPADTAKSNELGTNSGIGSNRPNAGPIIEAIAQICKRICQSVCLRILMANHASSAKQNVPIGLAIKKYCGRKKNGAVPRCVTLTVIKQSEHINQSYATQETNDFIHSFLFGNAKCCGGKCFAGACPIAAESCSMTIKIMFHHNFSIDKNNK